MKPLFNAAFFARNRKALLEHVPAGVSIVLTGNGILQRSSDNTFSFQQDSSFWYLTGIDLPDIIVIFDNDTEIIIVPERSNVRQAFDGSIDREMLQRQSGFTQVLGEDDGWKLIEQTVAKSNSYATLLPNPAYIEQAGVFTNPARAHLAERISSRLADVAVHDVRTDVARLRMIKQSEELQALQTAIDITVDTLLETVSSGSLAAYQHEYQLDADITRGFRYRGARGHGFDPIVAGGANATTLHNVANDSPLQKGDLVVIDVGAEYQHYCADITRTWSVSGKPTSRQQAVYDAVVAVQEYAMDLLNPGMIMKDYEKAVETRMGLALMELGLIETADHEQIRKYYPHATSHFLGIDPHDAGDYAQPLAPGMVLTVEPGIYIPEEKIGVRIEDDVLITESGIRVLTEKLPKAVCPQ